MDLYRIVMITVVLTAGWLVGFVGMKTFRQELEKGPPSVNIVEVDVVAAPEAGAKPEVTVTRVGKYVEGRRTMSPGAAEEMANARLKKMWISLAAGIAGMAGTFFAAQRFWGNWLVSLGCVLVGPVMIAYGFQFDRDDG
ncbi:MAG: hypothetical protein WCK77_03950 [Verrucomicrobiota bacterium]